MKGKNTNTARMELNQYFENQRQVYVYGMEDVRLQNASSLEGNPVSPSWVDAGQNLNTPNKSIFVGNNLTPSGPSTKGFTWKNNNTNVKKETNNNNNNHNKPDLRVNASSPKVKRKPEIAADR
eukprot:UN31404